MARRPPAPVEWGAPSVTLMSIVISWKGPYFLEEVRDVDDAGGLYLLTGRQSYERWYEVQ